MINRAYSEDFFQDSRMSMGDHLDDLRSHLLRAFKWFVIGMVLSFFVGSYVVRFISQPVEDALMNYHIEYYKKNPDKESLLIGELVQQIDQETEKGPNGNPAMQSLGKPRTLQVEFSRLEQWNEWKRDNPEWFQEGGKHFGKDAPSSDETFTRTMKIKPAEFLKEFQGPLSIASKGINIKSFSPQETFMVYFKVCMITGFVISSPMVFYHVWSFIAAGLYPHEKKLVNVYLPLSLFLFLGGVAICQFAIIPGALKALLEFNLWLNVEPDIRLNEWLSFAIWMPVITGLCFQTPLVMFFMGKLGMFTADQFRAKRKIAIFFMLIFAALVSPSVDPGSLLLMWVPMVFLYELGIWMVKWAVPQSPQDLEVPYEPGMESNVSVNGEAQDSTSRD